MHLDVKALAIAVGLVTGIGMLILGLLGMLGIGVALIKLLAVVYVGFDATLVGAIMGFVWGTIEGLVGGFLIGYIYNKVVASG